MTQVTNTTISRSKKKEVAKMSKMKKMQQHQLENPQEWLDAYMEDSFFWRNTRIFRELIGFLISICSLVGIIFWVFYPNQCLSLYNPFKNISLITNVTEDKIPAIVWYTRDFLCLPLNKIINCTTGSKVVKCQLFRPETQPEDAMGYLFDAAQIVSIPLPRTAKTIWGLLHYESPIARVMFLHDDALNLFNFSATFSRYSDVPVPFMWIQNEHSLTSPMYYIDTATKNSYLNEISPVLYLQSNCNSATSRDAYVKKLMEYIPVDSYGLCVHNKRLPLDRIYVPELSEYSYMKYIYGQELMKFIAKYKFVIAIENAICNDYVTEKFWRAIEVGTVPIYYGSPLIRDWLPNAKSAILLEDFPTPELLSRHLHYLLRNDTAYEEYLEHKIVPLVRNRKFSDKFEKNYFQKDFRRIVSDLECKVCERLHEDSDRVNIVPRKHYDCSLPKSALTLAVNPEDVWMTRLSDAKVALDQMLDEIRSPDPTLRSSKTQWVSYTF